MRAQGVENLPHHLEARVVVQRLRRRDIRRHRHRQDDVSVGLALRLAHHPAHGLHHVDHGVTRIEENHRIQRGHVNALGQATRVGEDARVPIIDGGLQPRQLRVPLHRVHAAVDVLRLDVQVNVMEGDVIERGLLFEQTPVVLDQPGVRFRDLRRRLDVAGKSHRPAHRFRALIETALLALQGTRALRQTVPRADHRRGQGQVDGLATGTHHRVGGDRLVDRHHQHLVIGEQALFHSLAEAQPVELGAVNRLVIHGGQLRRMIGGLALHGVVEKPRSRRHVQALGRADVAGIVNLGEVRRLLAGQRHTRGAMRLIANDQIEILETLPLRIMHRRQRLIRGKHHVQALEPLARGETRRDIGALRRHRHLQVVGGDVLGLLRHL